MGCTYERKRLAGTDCLGCTCDRKQFRLYNCIFSSSVHISIFERSPVAHDLIWPSVCAGRAYPRWFLGRVGSTPPYRPHSLGDGFKCRRGKGLQTVCLARRCTSDASRMHMSDECTLLITQVKNGVIYITQLH